MPHFDIHPVIHSAALMMPLAGLGLSLRFHEARAVVCIVRFRTFGAPPSR
jgi:hypothetical protein